MATVAESAPARAGAWRERLAGMKRLLRPGLAAKIALAVGAVGMVIIVSLTSYMYGGSLRIMEERNEERVLGSVEVAASRFRSRTEFYRQDTQLLARTPPPLGIARADSTANGVDPLDGSTAALWRDRLAMIFASMLQARPEYFRISYIDARGEGREIVRVDRLADRTIARIPEDRLQPRGNRDYVVRTARLAPREVYVSEIGLNRDSGAIEVPHRPVMHVATPVLDKAGNTLGIVVINIDLRQILDIVSDSFSDAGTLYVTNANGDYLKHPDPAKTFGFDLGHRYLIQDDFPGLQPIFGSAADILSTTLPGPSGKSLAVAERVRYDPANASQHIVLVRMLPVSALARDVSSLRNRTILVSGALLVLSLAAATWLIGWMIGPLTTMGNAAVAVANGSREVDFAAFASRQDEIGTLARSFASMVDEVHEREAENSARTAQLSRTNNKLIRSNQELAQFAYVASHDLQEPLRMVDSYMGLIERRYKGKLDADADEFIGYAVDGARRMKRLINDLLDYSRVSNRPLQFATIDTSESVEAAKRLLQARIAENDATVDVGRLPVIEADTGQMERLFMNLIGNAIKFRGEAAPVVRIAAERKDEGWEFVVADNGIGIAPEFRQKVFDIFTRLHSRAQYEGTGIGLAACRRIVELHGGRIWIEDAPEGGVAFRFLLPAKQDGA